MNYHFVMLGPHTLVRIIWRHQRRPPARLADPKVRIGRQPSRARQEPSPVSLPPAIRPHAWVPSQPTTTYGRPDSQLTMELFRGDTTKPPIVAPRRVKWTLVTN